MLNPATTIVSTRSARRRYAASTSAAQSAQPVSSMSSTTVPWPGSRGSSTCRPSAAAASAIARIDDGLPVKPCNANRPVVAVPTWVSGSAPSMIDVLVMALFYRFAGGVLRRHRYGSSGLPGSSHQSSGTVTACQSGSG